MNSKKITAFLLSTAMMIGSVPAFVFAEDSEPADSNASESIVEPDTEEAPGGTDEEIEVTADAYVYNDGSDGYSGVCGDNVVWNYDVDTKTLTVSGTGDMYDYDTDSYPDEVSPWKKGDYSQLIASEAEHVVIGEGVTNIGSRAFYRLPSLKDAVIPSTVKRISTGAFYYCPQFTSVIIPEGVERIDKTAFAYCGELASVSLPQSVSFLDQAVFTGCTSLRTIVIPRGVTTIEGALFNGCSNLEEVVLPDGITRIEDYAFYECVKLKDIVIPDSVVAISNYAFESCSSLEEINIPDSVQSLGKGVFNGCSSATSVHISANMTEIPDETFSGCKSLKQVTIPDNIKSVGVIAFLECENLVKVTLPSSLTVIKSRLFEGCTKLEYVNIPDGVTTIESAAFRFCESLPDITIPSGVTVIDMWTFEGCHGLTEITIPAGVTSIGYYAFRSCINLKNIYFLPAPQNENELKIHKDSSVTGIPNIYVCSGYEDVYSKILKISTDDINSFTKCGDNAYWYLSSPKQDETYRRLNIVGNGDMYDYSSSNPAPWKNSVSGQYIRELVIGDGITSIGTNAFANLSINTVSIGKESKLRSIGNSAFSFCRVLEDVKDLPASLTTIGELAFFECNALRSIRVPDGVTSIGRAAFVNCYWLPTITIPADVTFIGADAFLGCDCITDVYCFADPAELTWNENNRNDFAFSGNTRLHVLREYYDEYIIRFANEVNAIITGDLERDIDIGTGEHLYGYSVSISNYIGANFYVSLPEYVSDSAYMQFTVDGVDGVQKVSFSDVKAQQKIATIADKTYYIFTCNVPAKNMASEITAQMFDRGEHGTEYTFSINKYGEYLYQNTEDANVRNIVKAMLDYGACAKDYFKVSGASSYEPDYDGLDNVSIDGSVYEYGTGSAYAGYGTVLPASGISLYAFSLSLKSEITLSVYLQTDLELSDITCTAGGKTYDVEQVISGGYTVLRIRNIDMSDLNRIFVLSFNADDAAYHVDYCPLTYCYTVLQRTPDPVYTEKLMYVCKALYRYWETSKDY